MYQNERSRRDQSLVQTDKLQASHELTSAEEFAQLYYEKLDAQQHQVISRLYLPEALLVWNGITILGPEKIQEFVSKFPKCTHNVISLDTQRLNDATSENKTFLIKTGGVVRYKDHESKQFFHSFFTTMVDGKYKISIDNYRCINGTP